MLSSAPRFFAARLPALMLLGATFFWGWTFPVVKAAIAETPVFAFLAARFFLAALLMAPFAARRGFAAALPVGSFLGVLLFLAFAFQTLGLARTTAANCGFVTGLNVVWVAVFAAFFSHRKPSLRVWAAVAAAMAGMLFLLAPSSSGGDWRGDALTLVCSFFIAWHILVLDSKTRGLNSEALTAIQFFIVAALCLAASLAAGEKIEIDRWGGAAIFALVLTVLGATMFSFWAQTRFQPRLPPVTAALIFVMEPVFAALFAALFYGESVSATAGIGAALILAAMAVAAREAAAAAARKRQPRPLA